MGPCDYYVNGNSLASSLRGGVVNSLAIPNGAVFGRDSGLSPYEFFYAPEGWKVFFLVATANVTAPTSNFQVDLETWTGPGTSNITSLLLSTLSSGYYGVIGSLVSTGGWYRPVMITPNGSALRATSLQVMITNANATNVIYSSSVQPVFDNVGATSSQYFYPFSFPAEFTNSVLPWMGTRTTAAAVLLTNVTQVLNKAGTVLAGRVNPNLVNPFTADSTSVNNLHPAEKSLLGLETGFYTYCPPSTDLAQFWDYSSTPMGGSSGNTSMQPLYRLDNDSFVNLIFLQSSVAYTMAVNVDWHIEFRTTSALFQIGLSAITLEAMHQAQLALVSAGFFFSNEDHKDDINSITSKVKNFARRVAPVAKVASQFAPPPLQAALKLGNMLLSQKHVTVKPTAGKVTKTKVKSGKKDKKHKKKK